MVHSVALDPSRRVQVRPKKTGADEGQQQRDQSVGPRSRQNVQFDPPNGAINLQRKIRLRGPEIARKESDVQSTSKQLIVVYKFQQSAVMRTCRLNTALWELQLQIFVSIRRHADMSSKPAFCKYLI